MATVLAGAAAILLFAYFIAEKGKIPEYRRKYNRWTIPFCAAGLILLALVLFGG